MFWLQIVAFVACHCHFFLTFVAKYLIMGKGSLLFVPVGGLANRMRAVASAYNLALHTGVRLSVVWFRDWAVNARFFNIFEPVKGLSLRDATFSDLLLLDRPRRRNLWLPALPEKLVFQQRINEKYVDRLKHEAFDFDAWAAGKKSWMSCYSVFGNPDDRLYAELFHPVKEVMDKVEAFTDKFSSHTIGFHIRRTDNQESIEGSPLQLFIDAADREITANTNTKIFVATDDEPTKAELRKRFGSRIITAANPASRSSVDGIRDGLVDMYTLARTAVIFGSAGSSFSPMAAKVGGARIEILRL